MLNYQRVPNRNIHKRWYSSTSWKGVLNGPILIKCSGYLAGKSFVLLLGGWLPQLADDIQNDGFLYYQNTALDLQNAGIFGRHLIFSKNVQHQRESSSERTLELLLMSSLSSHQIPRMPHIFLPLHRGELPSNQRTPKEHPKSGWIISGWWMLVVYLPLWKILWKSVGMMTFPIYGKIKFMFQTTHQIYSHVTVIYWFIFPVEICTLW